MDDVFGRRRAGVLLHPTSLPGPGANGTIGPEARRFVDFLRGAGFTVWQTLPLGPADRFGSPYSLRSEYAGNPGLVDDEPCDESALAAFARRHRRWLLPYALFRSLEGTFRAPWWQWPAEVRDRRGDAIRKHLARETAPIRAVVREQYRFQRQWTALKRYANESGVYLFGDVPFYANRDSVDVWWNRRLFRVGAHGEPEAVAGVPPDYFNADGQLWGNPLYRWDRMEREGFHWWIDRLGHQLERFDLVRIDHFRAFAAYWEIRAGAATAAAGRWRPGYGEPLLTELRRRRGSLPLVAEDLGDITDDVRALRDRFSLPGMAVLQFAFDGSDANPHLPRNHRVDSVVYTGTHDNDTTRGWFDGLDADARRYVCRILGCAEPDAPASMVEAAYASPARIAVIPFQDVLGIGSEGRMNTPGTTSGNWLWRFDWNALDPGAAARWRDRARRHGRFTDG